MNIAIRFPSAVLAVAAVAAPLALAASADSTPVIWFDRPAANGERDTLPVGNARGLSLLNRGFHKEARSIYTKV